MASPRNSRNAQWKTIATQLLRHLLFNLSHLPLSGKTALTGVLICGIALFIPWLHVNDGSISIAAGAFSQLAGRSGFFILPVLFILGFLTVSTHRKENIKSRLSIPFYDYTVSFFGGLSVLLVALVVFNTSIGFAQTIGGSIQIAVQTSGLTFEILGGLLICIGGILNYKEKKKELLHMIYLENLAQKENEFDSYAHILGKEQAPAPAADRNNMSLPL